MRHYLIDEELLTELLIKAYKYEILESAGVNIENNYMPHHNEYVLHYASQLPKNENIPLEQLAQEMDDWSYSLEDLANDEIRAYWQPYHERCGKECQFKFKAKPQKAPVDNH